MGAICASWSATVARLATSLSSKASRELGPADESRGAEREILLSYWRSHWLHDEMKRTPDLIEIEFGILAFILAIGMGYPAVRWLLAMIASF